MKLFGEFLVRKGHISENDLLQVLLDQIRSTPSMAEIVHQHQLMSDSDLVSVLAYQAKRGVGFRSACEALNLWTLSLEVALSSEASQHRLPLGRLLVERKLLSLDKMTTLLETFFKEELSATEPPEPQGYPSIFDDVKRDALQRCFRAITSVEGNATTNLPPLLLNALEAGRVLRGASQVARATKSNALLSSLERSLLVFSENLPDLEPALMVSLGYVYDQTVEFLWTLKEELKSKGSEDGTWNASKDLIEALMGEMDSLSQKVPARMKDAV